MHGTVQQPPAALMSTESQCSTMSTDRCPNIIDRLIIKTVILKSLGNDVTSIRYFNLDPIYRQYRKTPGCKHVSIETNSNEANMRWLYSQD